MSKSGQQDKSFAIRKQLVWEAYKRVKANKGAAGADRVSMEEFEEDLRGNLYKIWNRMSSGTYFPPPVKAVEIPKPHGGTRILGVPTVGDRIAQTVGKLSFLAGISPFKSTWVACGDWCCACSRISASRGSADSSSGDGPVTKRDHPGNAPGKHGHIAPDAET